MSDISKYKRMVSGLPTATLKSDLKSIKYINDAGFEMIYVVKVCPDCSHVFFGSKIVLKAGIRKVIIIEELRKRRV